VTHLSNSPSLAASSVAARIRQRLEHAAETIVLVEASGRRVNGPEFLQRCDAWRTKLTELNIGSRSIVGISMPRSIDQVAAVVAVMEVGAAYVPIDPTYPPARRELMMRDCAIGVVLGEQSTVGSLLADRMSLDLADGVVHESEGTKQNSVAWVAPPSWLPFASNENVASALYKPEPDDLAYVIYTSGSTGTPKGVQITHGNLNAFIDSWDSVVVAADNDQNVHAPLAETKVWLALTSLSFDPSVVELLWTLINGWTVVLAPDNPGPGVAGSLIERFSVTHLQVTPTRAAMLLADPDDCAGLDRLDHLLVGGEVLTSSLAKSLAARVANLTNVYGPTETTVWAFSHVVSTRTSLVDSLVDPVPIGRPLPGVTALLVNQQDEPVPPGTVGEIVLLGENVSPGYHNRSAETERNFRPIDYEGLPTPCYRTGDLALENPSGDFNFHGRADNQLKISGHRIEPAEVESVLLTEPGVKLAVVVQREVAGVSRLVAFVEPQENVALLPDTLRRVCSEYLPKSHLPSVFVVKEKLPLTPSGKVDRAALVVPANFAFETAGPTNDDDRLNALCQLWTRVLSQPVSPDDDYFALGGDSMGAVAILAEVERTTGEQLGLAVLVSAPTPRMLLAEIDAGTGYVSPQVLLHRSSSQARILFLVHGAGGNVVNFRHLVPYLPADMTLIAFQANGVATPDAMIDESIEAMADRYIHELLLEQPHGPYLLGGYSDGGLVAWEMARSLRKRGETVTRILLLDTALPPTPKVEGLSRGTQVANLLRNLRDRQRPLQQWLRDIVRAQRLPKTVSIVLDTDLDRLPNVDVQPQVEAATDAYLVSPLDIDVDLIRAANSRAALWANFRWKPYVHGRFRVTTVPGDHLAIMLNPGIAALGRAIADRLST
jgi:amino acid adenylation domain-containing protein